MSLMGSAIGMDEKTGRLIRGVPWLRQAVGRGLRTRKGSRMMARWYGTDYMGQLGQPITAGSMLDLTSDLSDTVEASIPGARPQTILEQDSGERLRVLMRIDAENISLEV